MKNYRQMLIITLVIVVSWTKFDVISAAQRTPIVSTSSGSNSLVDAIKQHSDITVEDVDKWKFLRLILGKHDVIPAAAMVGSSAYGAYRAATAGFGYAGTNEQLLGVKDYIAPMVTDYASVLPETMKNSKFWAGIVGLGAGVISYSYLYPRMRHGVLAKVQDFITVCGRLAIARNRLERNEFPEEWRDEEPVAACRALHNLIQQGHYAVTLLNYVGRNDAEVARMLPRIRTYNDNLRANRAMLGGYCNQFIYNERQEEDRSLSREVAYAQLFGMKLQNVKNVLSIIKTVGNVLYTGAKDVMTWTVDNPLPAGLIGVAASYYWPKKK